MRPLLNPPKPSSSIIVFIICAFAVPALFVLTVNLDAVFSGKHIYSDYSAVIFLVLPFLFLTFFIPIFLGVILLEGFLRYQLHKGWLTPIIGILSGMGVWGLAGIGFCLLFIVFDPFPPDPSLQPHNFWEMIPLLLDEVFLSGIAIACLVGGWAGYALSKQILFDQQSPLAEK
jgi:hypothetical protein